MSGSIGVLTAIALVSALGAAVILVAYLFRRPALGYRTKIWLFFGLGPLPLAAALSANAVDYEHIKRQEFCGSCHIMKPYTDDARAADSPSLAAVHARTKWFGDQACYACHADYGMMGAVTTKIGGLYNVYSYYTKGWSGPHPPELRLTQPYSTTTCMRCHSFDRLSAGAPIEHRLHREAIVRGSASCTNQGCHGSPHERVHQQAAVSSNDSPERSGP